MKQFQKRTIPLRKKVLAAALSLLALTAVLTVCLFCGFAHAQSDAPEVIIEAGVTKWRYKAMTAERYAGYTVDWGNYATAGSWQRKASPFGDRIDYNRGSAQSGWDGDNHVLLLMTNFQIDDLDRALKKEFVAHVWYDSNMKIYLNGVEVLFAQGHVDNYVDLKLDFSAVLQWGVNILAVSIEDQSGGREFDMTLTMQTPNGQQPADPTPDPALTVTEKQLAETGLSTVYIDTADGDYVKSRLEYSDANLHISLSDSDKNYTNAYTTDSGGDVRVKGRGNSTWNNGYADGKQNTLPGDTHTRKVPYTLKLSQKADLFGMGKSKKWVLIANYMDRTMLRNKLIYDLSGRMGMVFCKSVYVNLVLNGEYMGTYVLTQKIDPDLFGGQVTDWDDVAEDFAKAVAKERGYSESWQSDFEDQLCADLSWLTSKTYKYKNATYTVSDYVNLSKYSVYYGYLMEYDGYADEDSFFTTNHGVPLKVSNMEAIKTNPVLFEYVRGFFNDFEEACYGENFLNSKGKHYSEYVDMNSLVDCFILNTVILNVEFGYKSMYMYIRSDGKIVFGPCWDYDWSSGNPFLWANGDYNQWYNDGRAENNKWFRKLYGDPWFVALVRERWSQLGGALDDMVGSMDYYYKLLSKAEVLEYAKFSSDPYERDFAWRTGGRSFKDECDQLKTFLINRIAWLNEQFAKREPNIEGRGMSADGSLALALSGPSVTAGGALSDYYLSKASDDFTLSVTSWHSCTAQVWINGTLKYTLNLSRNSKKTQSVPRSVLKPGINTITVYQYSGNTLYGANWLTVSIDGQKRAAPAAGSFTSGYADAGSQPPQTGGVVNPPNPPAVTSESRPATSEQTPATSGTPVQTDPPVPGTTEPENSAGTEPAVPTDPAKPETSNRPATSGESPDRTEPITSGGTATTAEPQKTPTPTGGTASIDPVSPNEEREPGGGWILPVVIIGIAALAAGSAAGIVIWIKRKKQ